jgi:hypothetical protein
MGILTKKGLIAGAIAALVTSILHSQMFRSDVFGWAELLAWYLVSLLLGCIAGFIAGLLISRIPARVNPSAAYFGGALFGIFGYFIQSYLFLMYVIRNSAWV